MFPCEICNIFKNIFFTEHLRWILLTQLFLMNKKSLEDSSEAILTSLLVITLWQFPKSIHQPVISHKFVPYLKTCFTCLSLFSHCVESVQLQSFFWSVFGHFSCSVLLTLISFFKETTGQNKETTQKNTFWHLIVKRKFNASYLGSLKHANGSSSHPEVFYKKGVLEISQNSQ